MLTQEIINKYAEMFTEDYDKYYVFIDGKPAMINQASKLGYNTRKESLKAFARRVGWYHMVGSNDPDYKYRASTFINKLIEQGRLEVMTFREFIEYNQNE